MLEFPKGFLWGAATSAYQVEGNNCYADWWRYEAEGKLPYRSQGASGHYERYQEDFALAASLHHNAHRFSVEWSRLEPREGEFIESEFEHYRQVIATLRQRNLEPVVTLHHFTNPDWFMQKGGWENPRNVRFFVRFVSRVLDALGKDVRWWITFNEPLIYLYFGYVFGLWPPQKKSPYSSARVLWSIIKAHVASYRLIHSFARTHALATPYVTIAHHMRAYVVCQDTLRNRFACWLRDRLLNHALLEALRFRRSLDCIGINYYSRDLVDTRGWLAGNLLFDTCVACHQPVPQSDMGWDIYPQGLYQIVMSCARYRLPVYIFENGIFTRDDGIRWDFIASHLQSMHRAIQDGALVRGYFYWSLLDNFEWDKGFVPRFGLIEVNYETFKRDVRISGRKFAEVCKTGILS